MRAAINNLLSTKFILMGCILRLFMLKFTKREMSCEISGGTQSAAFDELGL